MLHIKVKQFKSESSVWTVIITSVTAIFAGVYVAPLIPLFVGETASTTSAFNALPEGAFYLLVIISIGLLVTRHLTYELLKEDYDDVVFLLQEISSERVIYETIYRLGRKFQNECEREQMELQEHREPQEGTKLEVENAKRRFWDFVDIIQERTNLELPESHRKITSHAKLWLDNSD